MPPWRVPTRTRCWSPSPTRPAIARSCVITSAPDQLQLLIPDAGLSPEQVAEARDLAAAALASYRDAGSPPPPALAPDELSELFEFLAGATDPDMTRLLREELGPSASGDLRTPAWSKGTTSPPTDPFTVAVIGAGMSGILAAHRLRQAGLDVVVIEKNDDVGGTWFENTYPGCRVDMPNHFYSYSFAQTRRLARATSRRSRCCSTTSARWPTGWACGGCIRFDTEVTAVELDESTMTWTLQLAGPGGGEESSRPTPWSAPWASSTGPTCPTSPGIERFAGRPFHSARWDHEVDLAGKQVVVIGTGASAAQFIPDVAEAAARPHDLPADPGLVPAHARLPRPGPRGRGVADAQRPGYANWYRFWMFWRNVEGLLAVATVDPEWWAERRRVGQRASTRASASSSSPTSRASSPTDPELPRRSSPTTRPSPSGSSVTTASGPRTLLRDDVDLVTERIARDHADGVRTVDGTCTRPT